MNRRLYILAGILVAGCAVPAAVAQDQNPAAPPVAPRRNRSRQPAAAQQASSAQKAAPAAGAATFADFRKIAEYNIFDSSRTGPVTESPHGDTIAFVGTMESAKGTVAFFDGSSKAWRQVAHTGDTVADFTVTNIRADHADGTERVDLTRGAKTLTLVLGQQLFRPPGEDWQVASAAPPPMGAPSAFSGTPGSATPAATATASPDIPSDDSDVIKKLIEKRQQQLKQ